jgi:small subunit ribosomal protein S1
MIDVSGGRGRVELGEGVVATCRIPEDSPAKEDKYAEPAASSKPDLSSLGSMLQARWKSGAPESETKPEALRAGQIRKFRIAKLDPVTKQIDLELD